jgi:oxalate decarboxylase
MTLNLPEFTPGGSTSWSNNVPDPLMSTGEIPAFTFDLEASKGKQDGKGSFGKEVTVAELPISKGIAGVSMRLEPGVMRELHWHATAAEWGFVLSGRVRTTIVDPAGHQGTDDFNPGDCWFFPRGHPHVLEALGDEPCHFLLIFDNGYFTEYGTFAISDWMAQLPREILAKSLRVPESALTTLPSGEIYFGYGDVPPEPADNPHGGIRPSALPHRYPLLDQEPELVCPGGREWKVESSQFPIQQTMTGVYFEIDPGGMRELHWHPNADEWQYVVEGEVRVTLFGAKGRYRQETLTKGQVAYIPQGYGHSIENVGTTQVKMVIGLNAGVFQKIDLSQFVAAQPDDVLRTNLTLPQESVDTLPTSDFFFTDGSPAT